MTGGRGGKDGEREGGRKGGMEGGWARKHQTASKPPKALWPAKATWQGSGSSQKGQVQSQDKSCNELQYITCISNIFKSVIHDTLNFQKGDDPLWMTGVHLMMKTSRESSTSLQLTKRGTSDSKKRTAHSPWHSHRVVTAANTWTRDGYAVCFIKEHNIIYGPAKKI